MIGILAFYLALSLDDAPTGYSFLHAERTFLPAQVAVGAGFSLQDENLNHCLSKCAPGHRAGADHWRSELHISSANIIARDVTAMPFKFLAV